MFDDLGPIFILGKTPQEWTPEEADTICRIFKESCDHDRHAVDASVVTKLWRYWFLAHGERPLLEEAKYNMALMLGAKALGEFVPPPSGDSFFSRYRQEHAAYDRDCTPPLLTWANPTGSPLLESTVTCVTIFRAGDHIDEIIITGRPPAELQDEIFQRVFTCLLRIRPSAQDAIHAGLYHVLLPDSKQETFELPGITTSAFAPGGSPAATEALNNLVQELRLLQMRTELVTINEVSVDDRRQLDGELRDYARQAFQEQRPIILAKDPQQAPALNDLVTLSPYRAIAKRARGSLAISLPLKIIDNSSFEDLLKAFTLLTVERVRIDARIRKQGYEKRAQQLRDELRQWQEADAYTRQALWQEMVQLTERFYNKTGTTVRLAQPEEISKAEWLQQSVPGLIRQYEEWARQMQKIIDDVTEATRQEGAPIRRLAANYFLDVALRGRREAITDPALRDRFERWAGQITPYLRCQWYIALENKGLDPETVFNRHTVFHTHFQIDDYNKVTGLIMQPLALTSPADTVYVFDPEKGFMTSHAVGDKAQAPANGREGAGEELWRQLIDSLSGGPFVNQTELNDLLLASLRGAPAELFPRLIAYLYRTGDGADATPSAGVSQTALKNLNDQLRLLNFPAKMITFYIQRAFHSARQLIREIRFPPRLRARATLWQVLIECAAEGQNPMIYIPGAAQFSAEPGSAVGRLLKRARQEDAEFVDNWVQIIENNQDLLPAISMLRRDWLRKEEILDPFLQKVYDVESAVEPVSQAGALEKTAESINADGESAVEILAKTGLSLADLLLSDSSRVPYSDVLELLEILTGEEVRRT